MPGRERLLVGLVVSDLRLGVCVVRIQRVIYIY